MKTYEDIANAILVRKISNAIAKYIAIMVRFFIKYFPWVLVILAVPFQVFA